jgi:hypothetical protein
LVVTGIAAHCVRCSQPGFKTRSRVVGAFVRILDLCRF